MRRLNFSYVVEIAKATDPLFIATEALKAVDEASEPGTDRASEC
jgi:hypothetical protein